MSLASKIGRNLQYAVQEASLRVPFKGKGSIADDIVVSLTSYPGRIGTVWKTLETVYRQSVLPAAVVLVLATEEFQDKQLPDSVLKFQELGLRIMFVDKNIRSYKKLIPVMKEYGEKSIVTADDDVLYPHHWLGDLIGAHRSKPGTILGHRGTVIQGNGEYIEPYVAWPQATTRSPAVRLFLTGMGGVLYPPEFLRFEQTTDMDLAMELAPTADDIWFKAMALISGTNVSKVSDGRGDFLTVRSAQRSSLRDINVSEGRNEIQFRAVMDHFDLWGSLDTPTN